MKCQSGAPMWPDGVAGSISHSQKWAGALVGSISSYHSIGLDIESIGRVTQDLWHLFFNDQEIDFLKSRSAKYQELFSTILYSMKEAFFKMQFQLTQKFIEFKDCEIISQWGQFSVRSIRDLGEHLVELVPMHYEVSGDQVITYGLLPTSTQA